MSGNGSQPSVRDLGAYLFGPWIFHRGSCWSESEVPDWARGKLHEERLLALAAKWGLCSNVEAAIYLSSASSAAPLPSEWVVIFQYSVGQAMGTDHMPEDLRVAELSPYHRQIYDDLRAKIFSAVVKHAKEGGKRQAGRRSVRIQSGITA